MQSSGQLHDLVRDGIDVGIRFGQGQYPGLAVERLMGLVLVSVSIEMMLRGFKTFALQLARG